MQEMERLASARRWYAAAVEALATDDWRKPSRCAGWNAANVVAHVATWDRYMRALVLDATARDPSLLASVPGGLEERAKVAAEMATWEPAKLRPSALQESEETHAALHEVMQHAADTKLRTPSGEVPVTRWVTVLTGEYIIHGHDLEPASGRHEPVPDWFVDSMLPQFVARVPLLHRHSPHKGKSASFHLHRTDGEGEWTLRAEGGEARCEPGHDRGDVALRGPGEGLYWVLMGRGSPAEHGVAVHGDPALASAFKEWFPGP